MTSQTASGAMEVYKVGDGDTRPWGSYVVTAVGTNGAGEEYCEKDITVLPGKILSLQSHEMRRETWTVKKGHLTVIRDGEILKLKEGEDVHLPVKSIHSMANLGDTECVVHELQEGTCREEDITRYVDSYGRGTDASGNDAIASSIAAYARIAAQIEKS